MRSRDSRWTQSPGTNHTLGGVWGREGSAGMGKGLPRFYCAQWAPGSTRLRQCKRRDKGEGGANPLMERDNAPSRQSLSAGCAIAGCGLLGRREGGGGGIFKTRDTWVDFKTPFPPTLYAFTSLTPTHPLPPVSGRYTRSD